MLSIAADHISEDAYVSSGFCAETPEHRVENRGRLKTERSSGR